MLHATDGLVGRRLHTAPVRSRQEQEVEETIFFFLLGYGFMLIRGERIITHAPRRWTRCECLGFVV